MRAHVIPLENNDRYSEALAALKMCPKDGSKRMIITDNDETRSGKQNRLSHALYEHIANHTGDMSEIDAKCECKYKFGVPIICTDYPERARTFELILKGLSRENRVTAMLEIPLTSILGVKAMTRYLDNIYKFYDALGYQMPRPDDLYFEAMGLKR